jgi:hypothetical protein
VSQDSAIYQSSDPDIFSRGSIKLTYDLLRKKNPALALTVRNLITDTPLPKKEGQLDDKNSDHFKVTLNSFEVRAVVEYLMEYGQDDGEIQSKIGMAVMAKALMEDWIVLAHKMVSELPKNQQP